VSTSLEKRVEALEALVVAEERSLIVVGFVSPSDTDDLRHKLTDGDMECLQQPYESREEFLDRARADVYSRTWSGTKIVFLDRVRRSNECNDSECGSHKLRAS
jgi:hypothetical protein